MLEINDVILVENLTSADLTESWGVLVSVAVLL